MYDIFPSLLLSTELDAWCRPIYIKINILLVIKLYSILWSQASGMPYCVVCLF